MKKYSLSFVFVLIYFIALNDIAAQEQKDIPISVSKPIYIKSDITSDIEIEESTKKKQYRLLPDSSVYRINTNLNRNQMALKIMDSESIREIKNNKNIVGKYLFAYSNQEAQNLPELNSSRLTIGNKIIDIEPQLINEFRVIIDEDDLVYFTDGSLLIKFNESANFAEFASFNNLMLKKEFIELNMGLYVYDDFTTLENKITNLEKMESVSEVQYDVINPYITPH